MKHSCPLCGAAIEVPEEAFAQANAMRAHAMQHNITEWLEGTQSLRDQLAFRDELRRIPYWAMPRA